MKDLIKRIKSLNIDELERLATLVRQEIIQAVSLNGGHLSSNLGSVELSVALHHLFDIYENPLIFDVSHQCYAHKILSGRSLESLRQFNGISGYTEPSESDADFFIAGHSSTSISLAVGVAKAFALQKKSSLPIAIIGDGAMGSGLAYEALNELGEKKYPCIIVLNDNKMSISKPIGALSRFLSQSMSSPAYQKLRSGVENVLNHLPASAKFAAKRFEDSIKLASPAGMFFEELGLKYIGPIDGHNIAELIKAFRLARSLNRAVIVHAETIKGYGYELAENDTGKWHGVSAFDIDTGKSKSTSTSESATAIFSEILLRLAEENPQITGLSAAMPSGTGMDKLITKFPERFFDVGIAEAHAVTSMAAMSKCGFSPVVAIYSTFLQRAYDSLIHDAGILNINMCLAIDRAGCVGNDGKTHQGAFDLSYLNCIPNYKISAPVGKNSFETLLRFATNKNGPVAIRYPRGSFATPKECDFAELKSHFVIKKGEILKQAETSFENISEISFICLGDAMKNACEIAKQIDANVINLVFAKPLDSEFLCELAKHSNRWFLFSHTAKKGGLNDILSGFLQEQNIQNVRLKSFEFEDEFITHGNTETVLNSLGLSSEKIAEKIKNSLI